MGKMSKTARASTRGKRVQEVFHVNQKGEKVQRVLFASNNTRRFMWMNEEGDLFNNKEVTVQRNI